MSKPPEDHWHGGRGDEETKSTRNIMEGGTTYNPAKGRSV